MKVRLMALRDVLGFLLAHAPIVWRSAPVVYRIALEARRRERGGR